MQKELQKFNFNMETIRLFDSFAGIGALHQALKELGVPVQVVGLSEIDVDAIISYAGVHELDLESIPLKSVDEMREYLMERNIGYSFEKDKSSIPRLRVDKLEKVYRASVITNNLGDISKLNYIEIPDFDLFNFSFPCTNVSTSGRREGLGEGTHSGLYRYGIEVIKAKKPQYIMIENVKGLISKKFIDGFYNIVEEIESLGYTCFFHNKDGKPKCLNAKDYGVPQNRERIFVICVRNDIKVNFKFPEPFPLKYRLKDVLESEVDEKYYLSKEVQDRFKPNDKFKDMSGNIVGTTAPDFRTIGQRDLCYQENSIMGTLVATDYKQPKQVVLQTSDNSNKPYFVDRQGRVQEFDLKENYIQWDTSKKQYNSQQDRAFYDEKLSGTIATNAMANVIENSEPLICASRGRNVENPSDRTPGIHTEQRLEINYSGTSNTLTTVQKDNYVLEPNVIKPEHNDIFDKQSENNINIVIGSTQKNAYVGNGEMSPTLTSAMGTGGGHIPMVGNVPNFRIRKLTPTECWRLMGFRDEHIHRAMELGVSNSQLYKQAGNSIVVDVLYYIFKELFKDSIVNCKES